MQKDNPFLKADKSNNASTAKPNFVKTGSRVGGAQSPKEAMLNWCKLVTKNYETVNIQNFGSSWADGTAFCALIHNFYPDAFDFSEIKPENKKSNFELAFDTAEKLGNVAPLLDVEDLMRMKVPDWKCIFTQVQLYYKRFQLSQGKGAHKEPQNLIPLPGATSPVSPGPQTPTSPEAAKSE